MVTAWSLMTQLTQKIQKWTVSCAVALPRLLWHAKGDITERKGKPTKASPFEKVSLRKEAKG